MRAGMHSRGTIRTETGPSSTKKYAKLCDLERRVRQEFSIMTDEDTEAVKQAFKEADVNQDGLLTREEFSDFFEQSGQPVSLDQLNQVYLVVDVDPKDDKLSEDEVLAFYDQMEEDS